MLVPPRELPGAVDHYVGLRIVVPVGASVRLGIDMVDVPTARCCSATIPSVSGAARADEAPQHVVQVSGALLGMTPVTHAQYLEFVQAVGHPPPPHWLGGAPQDGLSEHPVTFVDWFDAVGYCRFVGAGCRLRRNGRGARGTDARLYPWGNREPSARLANFAGGSKHGSTTRVHAHPEGAAVGLDMAGNGDGPARHMRLSSTRRGRSRGHRGGAPRVLRGGSFREHDLPPRSLRVAKQEATRAGVPPTSAFVLPETWGRSRELMATGTSLPSGRRRRSTRVPGKHASFSHAGACGAAKAISQDIRVIAVQSEAAPAAYRSWKTRTLVEDEMRTFAEGLATRVPFELPQTILWSLLDDFVLVSEYELRAAMVRMIETTRNLVEAAGSGFARSSPPARADTRGEARGDGV